MATSKLLKPTNVTISIPAGTDVPDQSVSSNCLDKEADAINALSDQIATRTALTITRTNNAFCDADSINRLKAYEFTGFYWIMLNLATASGTTSDFVEIGTISNYNALHDISITIPPQNGSNKILLVQIESTTGKIKIYGANNVDSTWYRTVLMIPKATI